MANIKDHSFIDHYPLTLLSMSQRVESNRKENELYYETPVINFNSGLDRNTIYHHFRKHLKKYLENIIKHSDEYIDAIYPDICAFIPNYDIVVTYGIYFQNFNEGFKGPEKQVLSFQDGDPLPKYSFRGISTNLFPVSFKIHAKANVFTILRK